MKYDGLTVRSSCLFWVAMESSTVESFSSCQSSGATSWGISMKPIQKITLREIYLKRSSFHCWEVQNINASHKNHFDPLWPISFLSFKHQKFGSTEGKRGKKKQQPNPGVHTVAGKTIKCIIWQPCEFLCPGINQSPRLVLQEHLMQLPKKTRIANVQDAVVTCTFGQNSRVQFSHTGHLVHASIWIPSSSL